jgi:hypothetical protein
LLCVRDRENKDARLAFVLPDTRADHAGDGHPRIGMFFLNLLDCLARHTLRLPRTRMITIAAKAAHGHQRDGDKENEGNTSWCDLMLHCVPP